MIRRMIILLVFVFAVAVGADAYFAQRPVGWPVLDDARSHLHEQVAAWYRQGLEWWDALQPRQRTVITLGSATVATALLVLGLFRWLTAARRRLTRRLRSISVPYFSHEVGEAENRFFSEAAVYPDSQRLRVTTEIVSDDWDPALEPPVLLLRLIAPGSGRFFDHEETARPTTPQRFRAVFNIDNLVALREEPGPWTIELLVQSED